MEGHGGAVAAIGPEAQGDLLGHGAAGHEDRRLLAQQSRDLALEVLDEGARAVGVGLLVGTGLLRQVGQDGAWPLRAMAVQEAIALRECFLRCSVYLHCHW